MRPPAEHLVKHPARIALAAGVYQGVTQIEAIFTPMAKDLRAAVLKYADNGKMTPAAMARILATYDRDIAPQAFGAGYLRPSPVQAIVSAQQRDGARLALQQLYAAIDARGLPPADAAKLKADATIDGT